ncbi:hypothetical protein T01_7937 [Trichinella spiralis]|uniref:Uncharacterized protein n=1 Tax=Trichinella spiralis TaxID=6334 RepID=A0A0V0ZH17_TRISP|nr:hypothetical protein T01_7937 [Trichinella spiralis]
MVPLYGLALQGIYTVHRYTNSDHIKEYERILGLRTLVSSNIYQYCGFLPVFLRTDVR